MYSIIRRQPNLAFPVFRELIFLTRDLQYFLWSSWIGLYIVLWMWMWMWILNLYSAISWSISIALSTLVFREKYSFQTTPKAAAAERWITETVWLWVPSRRTPNSEGPTAECTSYTGCVHMCSVHCAPIKSAPLEHCQYLHWPKTTVTVN